MTKVATTVIAVENSGNSKLGVLSATYASQASCPASCPLRGSGCYAEGGLMAIHTRRVNKAESTSIEVARDEATAIDSLTGKRPLRLHVVGDCPTDNAARLVSQAGERYQSRHGQPVWTYTHAWRDVDQGSWGGVSVLASCETPQEVKRATAKGYATAMIVQGHESPKAYTHNGVKAIPCQAQTRGATCNECKLCWRDNNLRKGGYTITFATHGTRKNIINRMLKGS